MLGPTEYATVLRDLRRDLGITWEQLAGALRLHVPLPGGRHYRIDFAYPESVLRAIRRLLIEHRLDVSPVPPRLPDLRRGPADPGLVP